MLDFEHFFRGKEMGGAVPVGTEGDSIFLIVKTLRKAVSLKTAGIGQNRPLPVDEMVQPA
jgi:hypothetical protein